MRKALVLFILLLAVGLGGMAYAAVRLDAREDQVTLTETVLYGDPAEAEGALVEVHSHYDHHLFWDTTYVEGGTPDTWTEFTYSNDRIYEWRDVEESGVRVETYADLQLDGYYDGRVEDPQGLEVAVAELIEQTGPGEMLDTEVLMSEYTDYYPIQFQIDLPGYYISSWDIAYNQEYLISRYETYDEEWKASLQEQLARELRIQEAFEDFFRIPLLGDEMMYISVAKDEAGNVSNLGTGTGSGSHFYAQTLSAHTEEACYFTFDVHNYNGPEGEPFVMDTSHIPGGFGIYCLPYTVVSASELDGAIVESIVDVDGLQTVYLLDPNAYIEALYVSEDDSKLYLITVEEEVTILTVIDIATMQPLQRLEMGRNRLYSVYRFDDFWVAHLEDGLISLLELTEDGLFEHRFLAPKNPPGEDLYFLSDRAAMGWDGEKLVVAADLYVEGEGDGYTWRDETCGFTLAVYGADGELLYCGQHASSLSPAIMGETARYTGVRLKDVEPYSVRWDW